MIFPRKLSYTPGVITSSLVARLLTMIIIVQFVVTSELCVSNIEVTVNTCTCTDDLHNKGPIESGRIHTHVTVGI